MSVTTTGSRIIGRNALVKLGSEVVARLASLLLTVLVARRLGENEFGVYSYALAVGLVISQLADLGLQVTSAREVAMRGHQARRFVALAFRAKCGLSLVVLAALALFTCTRPAGLQSTYLLLGLAMLAQTFLEFTAYVYRGQQDLSREARLLAGARVLMALTGAIVLWEGGRLAALALAIFLPTALSAGYAIAQLNRSSWLALPADGAVDRSSAITVIRAALPLGIAIVISVAYTRLAILLLGHLLGAQAVAQFSAAQRLVEPWQIIPAAVMAAVFPAYARALATDRTHATQLGWASTAGLALLGCALALGIWLGAPLIVHMLYTETFAGSVPVLRVLGLSILPAFANYALTHLLIGRGQQRLNLLFVGLMFVLHAALSWRLIPTLGATGAAVSVVAAETLLMFCCVLALACTTPRPPRSH